MVTSATSTKAEKSILDSSVGKSVIFPSNRRESISWMDLDSKKGPRIALVESFSPVY